MDSPELHQEVSAGSNGNYDGKKDRGERLVKLQSLAVLNEACFVRMG